MILEAWGEGGTKRRFRQDLEVVCLDTGSVLYCPETENHWAWLKSEVVERFKALHPRTGARIKTVELEL